MSTKRYNPEIQLRRSEKYDGNYYVYLNEYTMNQLKELYEAAKETYEAAQLNKSADTKSSVGPLTITILNDEDRRFYTEERKFKYAPDATIKFSLPKESTPF